MSTAQTIQFKSDSLIRKKKQLNLALSILISFLGVTSLFIKFFLVDGVIAFRAFTVDGNLFTTIVSIAAVVVDLRELMDDKENESRRMFFLQLASAVTEAVIFIVVMIGYLPIFPDDPKITPYHMFCLHVAIPVLAVLRFIFFEKPIGILKPSKLLVGAIPIGVYGLGVVNAIKLGILPQSLIPYSFLDFKSNFLWYFVFALVVIPTFGFLWAWSFYRLNLRASLLWYLAEDVEKLQDARLKARSHFDTVNSAILLCYCALAIATLAFALHAMSSTSASVQHELMSYLSFYISEDYSYMLNGDPWYIQDGKLYKGDIMVGDGTEENMIAFAPNRGEPFDTTIYVLASDLSSEVADEYEGMEYVSVYHSSGEYAPVRMCGEVLPRELVAEVITGEDYMKYEVIKDGKEEFFHFFSCFGSDMWKSGVGIIEITFPMSGFVALAKDAEYNNDLVMIAVVVAIFALLYTLTNRWIRVLEKSVDFLKAIASGRIPEEPISLGKTSLYSGLERQLNVIREINES